MEWQGATTGVPLAWANSIEVKTISGGAGVGNSHSSSPTANNDFAASGKGSGAYEWGSYPVTQKQKITFIVGSGAQPAIPGRTTVVQVDLDTVISDRGGLPGSFFDLSLSASGCAGSGSGLSGTAWGHRVHPCC